MRTLLLLLISCLCASAQVRTNLYVGQSLYVGQQLTTVISGGGGSTVGPNLYPLKGSADRRYLVDAAGNPFFMIGASPQNMVEKLLTPDASDLLYNCRTNGFNSIWIFALAGPDQGAHTDGELQDGTLPFTSGTKPDSYDLSTPNEAYFSHVDLIVTMAATNGLNCLLHTLDVPSWLTGLKANGTNKCFAFGQYLGNRYKNYTNIIWVHGMDYNSYNTPADDNVVIAVAKGIQSADTNHLHTGDFSSPLYNHSDCLNASTWWGIMGLNWVYTTDPQYAQSLLAYNRTNYIPTFLGEARYEYEGQDVPGLDYYGSRNVERRQNYWALMSGANAGFLYGNKSVWEIIAGWNNSTNLHSPAIVDIQYLCNLFVPRQWYGLVPDQSHALITAGYGTYSTNGIPSTNNYVTAAKTANGTLGMVYTPVSATLTVAMTNFSGSVTSRWYDPSAGTFTAITGSPFANTITTNLTTPGNNSVGDGDWVLVLESSGP